MTREQLEFAISQYLDGTLPEADRLALEERLTNDESARVLLEEHRSLDRMMKDAMPLPAIKWERLAEVVAQASRLCLPPQSSAPAADLAEPADDPLEFAAMQHVDGDLAEEDQAKLRTAAGQELIAQHRALDVILKHAWPLPHVDWGMLRDRISEAVDAQEAVPSRYAIGTWLRYVPRLAAAAVLLLGIGLAIRLSAPASKPDPIRMVRSVDNTADVAVAEGPETKDIVVVDQGSYENPVVSGPRTMELAKGQITEDEPWR